MSLQGRERSSAAGGVRLAAASTIGKLPKWDLIFQDSMNRREAKVLRAHAAPRSLRRLDQRAETLGRPAQMVGQGLQEKVGSE